MSRFVRSSKYRHVFGTAAKAELSFQNCQVTRSAWDSNYIAANNKYWALCWQTGGGGTIAVWSHDKPGKLPQQDLPVIAGHKGAVLDIDWNPFNLNLLASVSEDGLGKIWQIPDGGLTEKIETPVQTLQGHRRKVGTVRFHPTANNVVVTSSTDYTVKIWDIEKGEATLSIDGHADIIHCTAWNDNGSEIATTCKDKKIRVADPRSGKFETEIKGHQGVKGSRVCWLGDKLFSIGSSRSSEREFNVHDPRNTEKHLLRTGLDNSSGIIMPFYDRDTGMLYLVGKGDGNIRYYEYTGADKLLYPLSEFKSNVPARGACVLPKTACKINECEVVNMLKLTTNMVVPISFKVPRKSEMFQDDIFPDTASGSGEPAMTSEQYFAGENKDPITVNLEKGFTPKEKPAQDFKPEVKVVDEGPKTEKELREAYETQKKRIAYLEAELIKRDARIKELEG